jgi:hypothetical protein
MQNPGPAPKLLPQVVTVKLALHAVCVRSRTMGDARLTAIQEEAATVVTCVRAQGQALKELVSYAQQVRHDARAALDKSRRIRAKVAARRAARPIGCELPR